ncbi:MAG: AraC family transcriptional regulator [Chitinophagaceae bacterium]|nr:AraC family transcriptional regulator [Chitinophagaceae bacterium]
MTTLDSKKIDQLRDLPEMIPVMRDFYEPWRVRVFNREQHECRNYLSPNRRDFYKILIVTKGIGLFTTGLNTYYIDQPTILFIHPTDIITWKNITPGEVGGYYVLFRKKFSDEQPMLKAAIEKYALFSDNKRKVIRLKEERSAAICGLFEKMQAEELAGQRYNEDAIQAYIQLLMLEASRDASFPEPDSVNDEYRHVHAFFNLLEQETAQINYDHPIRLRTAKEFASSLAIHPNHLNALLKKHTGENVSTHIKNRLLEESKVLLLHTDWTLQDIAMSIGFADQPNFNQFFKKNTGLTPSGFRKGYHNE